MRAAAVVGHQVGWHERRSGGANAGARLMLAPDWKPITWTEDERRKGQAWGLQDDRELPHPRHAAVAGPARRRDERRMIYQERSCIVTTREKRRSWSARIRRISSGAAGGAIALHARAATR